MIFNNVNYTQQRGKFYCVPTALCNAYKHYGEKISYRKHYNNLLDFLDTNQERGTRNKYFLKIVKDLDFLKTKVVHKTTVHKMKQHLDNNGIIFFIFMANTGGYHCSLIIRNNKNEFTFINYYTGKTITLVKHNVVDFHLSFPHICIYAERKYEN